MQQLLVEIFKEQAIDARIKGRYNEFIKSELYRAISSRYSLKELGE